MEIFPLIQAKLLCLAALCGVVGGILRDLIWGFEDMLKSRRLLVGAVRFLGDLVFVMGVCIAMVLLSYYYNDGEPRGFTLFGVLLGIFVYKRTFSLLTKRLARWALSMARGIILKILGPIVNILKILLQFPKKSAHYLRKALEKIIDMVYNIYVKKYVLRGARRGLLGRWKNSGG